jgi:hypothetical protein
LESKVGRFENGAISFGAGEPSVARSPRTIALACTSADVQRVGPSAAQGTRGGEPAGISAVLVGGYADIALRDFGLLLAALTLARLVSAYPGPVPSARRAS